MFRNSDCVNGHGLKRTKAWLMVPVQLKLIPSLLFLHPKHKNPFQHYHRNTLIFFGHARLYCFCQCTRRDPFHRYEHQSCLLQPCISRSEPIDCTSTCTCSGTVCCTSRSVQESESLIIAQNTHTHTHTHTQPHSSTTPCPVLKFGARSESSSQAVWWMAVTFLLCFVFNVSRHLLCWSGKNRTYFFLFLQQQLNWEQPGLPSQTLS